VPILTKKIGTLFVFSLLIIACDTPTHSEVQEEEPTLNLQQPNQDNWQRMQACTEQAEEMVKQYGWQKGYPASGKYLFGEVSFLEWQSHYSPKYERCYLRATFYTSLAPEDKASFYHLYDAFEGRLLAICSDGLTPRARLFCSIEEKAVSDALSPDDGRKSGDCEACQNYVADRWNY